jgi:hypothetical protein
MADYVNVSFASLKQAINLGFQGDFLAPVSERP